jgi:hypothetical protein
MNGRETEVPGENLLQRHFVHPMTWPGVNPATNRLSYGMAFFP